MKSLHLYIYITLILFILFPDISKANESVAGTDSLILYYTDVLKSKPDDIFALLYIGMAYKDKGDIEKAKHYLIKTLNLERERVLLQQADSKKLYSTTGMGADVACLLGTLMFEEYKADSSLMFYRQALWFLNQPNYITKDTQYYSLLALCYDGLGLVHYYNSMVDSSLFYYFKALSIYEKSDDKNRIVSTLNNIGWAYIEATVYDSALFYFNKSLKIAIEHNIDLVKQAMIYNNLGFVYYKQSKFRDALNAYNEANRLLQNSDDIKTIALNYYWLGTIHSILGESVEALKFEKEAYNLYLKIGNEKNLPSVIAELASIYKSIGELDSAFTYYKRGFEIAQKNNLYDDMARCLNGMAGIYQIRGNLSTALNYLEQVLEIGTKYNLRRDTYITLTNIAYIYYEKGRMSIAEEYYRKSLEIAIKRNDLSVIGSNLGSIGMIYNFIGKSDSAIIYCRKALEIANKSGDIISKAMYINNIAVIYYRMGNLDSTIYYQNWANSIVEQTGDSLGLSTGLSNIALLLIDKGEYDTALQNLQKALKISKKRGNKSNIAQCYYAVGFIYQKQGKYELAYNEYKKALSEIIIDSKLPYSFDNFLYPSSAKLTFFRIGEVFEKMGKADSAYYYYKKSIEMLEAIRGEIKDESSQASFMKSKNSNIYGAMISLLLKEGKPDSALLYLERMKSKEMKEIFENSFPELKPKDKSALDKEKELRKQNENLIQKIAEEKSKPDTLQNKALIDSLKIKQSNAQQEYRRYVYQLQKEHPEISSLVSINPANLKQVQKSIPQDIVMIEYCPLSDKLVIFTVSLEDISYKEVNITQDELNELIYDFRALISDGNSAYSLLESTEKIPSELIRNGKELYRMLINPIEDKIKEKKYLCIIPSGALFYIPFQALIKEDAKNGRKFLVEDYSIFYYTQSNFISEEKMKNLDVNILAFGNPDGTLPDAEKEVLSIKNIYPTTTTYIREKAKESTLMNEAKNYNILHFATHGVLNNADPPSSYIVMSAEKDISDGKLTMDEIWGMELNNTQLVTLSACKTALGKNSGGGEIVGLAQAFNYAGASSIIASLWNVDDESTGLQMSKFYANLKVMDIAKALQSAQKELMQVKPHPYFWAPFILIGQK